jgi:hypothetical protein
MNLQGAFLCLFSVKQKNKSDTVSLFKRSKKVRQDLDIAP